MEEIIRAILTFLILILVSYKLCYIITNKKKGISTVGAIMIAFSAVVKWQYESAIAQILILGQLALVLLNKFLTTEKFYQRILYLLGITISIILYIFTYFSQYMIPLGYVFIAITIWMIIKNKKNNLISKKDICFILVSIVLIIASCITHFKLLPNANKITPETKITGNGIPYLFSYLYSFLLPFIDMGDNASIASIISIFPIPMIMAMYYIYKKEKHFSFLLPMSIVAVLETVFCISGFPEIISKITLLQNVGVNVASVAVGFANFYLLIYILANIEEPLVSMKSAIRISLILMCVMVCVPLPNALSGKIYLSVVAGILCLYSFLFLNNADERYQKVLLTFLVIFTLVGALSK